MQGQRAIRLDTLRHHLLLALLAIVVGCAWLKPLDDLAGAQAQAGFKRAVASFATARALNAVISVVQGTAFSVQPLGVGVTLTPGQVLDPLNDLVERFSDLMLAASVAFGVQLLLIEMSVHWGMSTALTLTALAWAWQRWKRGRTPALLSRVLVALLLVRFIVPAAGMASDIAYQAFMQERYAASQQGIEETAKVIGAFVPDESAAGKRWWQLDKHIEQLAQTVDRTVEHAIRLIVIFLLQTLILPLAVFWVLLRCGRMLTVPPASRSLREERICG